ncbi:hypothetical protein [Thalassospira xianhensis]|nr:hypothetical protein [Thalassospira xianhensis]
MKDHFSIPLALANSNGRPAPIIASADNWRWPTGKQSNSFDQTVQIY